MKYITLKQPVLIGNNNWRIELSEVIPDSSFFIYAVVQENTDKTVSGEIYKSSDPRLTKKMLHPVNYEYDNGRIVGLKGISDWGKDETVEEAIPPFSADVTNVL